MKKKLFLCVFIAVFLVMAISTSEALMLSIDPLSQTVQKGDPVDAAVNISGLGDMTADSLSTFDLDISYDSSVLGFDSISFGDPVLGDQVDLSGYLNFDETDPFNIDKGLLWDYDSRTPGVVNFFEISFDMPWDLDMYQAGSFTLATLTFDTLSLGTSPLDISVNDLGDEWGDPLTADTIQNGNVDIVPEPATVTLLGSGLAGIGFWRRKKG